MNQGIRLTVDKGLRVVDFCMSFLALFNELHFSRRKQGPRMTARVLSTSSLFKKSFPIGLYKGIGLVIAPSELWNPG